jgi:hypothetical protein
MHRVEMFLRTRCRRPGTSGSPARPRARRVVDQRQHGPNRSRTCANAAAQAPDLTRRRRRRRRCATRSPPSGPRLAGAPRSPCRSRDTHPSPRHGPQAQTSARSFQLTIPAPQTNPAPKAASATVAPGRNRPSSSACASASGIDADDGFGHPPDVQEHLLRGRASSAAVASRTLPSAWWATKRSMSSTSSRSRRSASGVASAIR